MIPEQLTNLIAEAATQLPQATVRSLAASLRTVAAGDLAWRIDGLAVAAGDAASRELVARVLRGWAGGKLEPSRLADTLEGSCAAVLAERASQAVELVWTGPQFPGRSLRRTEQGLLEVIDAARRELWIVTFAAYRVDSVASALAKAVQRGVRVWVVAESADASDGRLTFDAARAIATGGASAATVLVWPKDRRKADAAGRVGMLHAKCALADDRIAFISSANLTEFALQLNIELGVVVAGGPLPSALGAQFRDLVRMGHWTPVGAQG